MAAWHPKVRLSVWVRAKSKRWYVDNLDRPLVEIWRVGNVTDRT